MQDLFYAAKDNPIQRKSALHHFAHLNQTNPYVECSQYLQHTGRRALRFHLSNEHS